MSMERRCGGEWGGRDGLGAALRPELAEAAREVVRRVLARIPARLEQAALFGSRARGEARPDSDVDLLLIFRHLPWDREPHASHAERLAEEVAAESGVPVTVWSVSLEDLDRGRRTPMLVDALADAVPFWWRHRPIPPLPFTPEDALHCVSALLERVAEGRQEMHAHLLAGQGEPAARRARDDLVRLCTGALLLRGETRPRRGDAVRRALHRRGAGLAPPPHALPLLHWAAESFGPPGQEDEALVPPPPAGPRALRALLDYLADRLQRRAASLERALSPGTFAPPADTQR